MTRPADLVLTNAVAYTLDPARPWATEIAIRDGRIEPETVRGPRTEVRDLRGAFVLPGLADVHNHHALAGRAELFELTLSPTASVEAICAAVRDHDRARPGDGWITGGSWASTLLPQVATPDALARLDAATGARPVLLSDDSRHNRWANSAALHRAGLTARPGGLLIEEVGLVAERARRADTPPDAEEHRRSSRRGIEILHSYGVTAFQDAGVSVDILAALHALDSAGGLDAWVVTSLLVNDHIFGFEPIGDALLAQAESYRSEHHRPDFVKVFLDGVPPAHTGAFLEPYLPTPEYGADFHGELTISPDALVEVLRATVAAGRGAKVHCTGDAAVRAVLDAVEAAGAQKRVQIAHGQFVAPADLPRFAALGVSADISPHLWTPGVIPQAIAEVLPPERAAHMQPVRSLLDTGAVVGGGSDWPVSETPNPWPGIQGLVTRQDPTGLHPGVLWPEEAVTLAE
ncbi:MAG: amidohydrolase, partial [Actinobacteria bacterium]|nr:amidohydrolase [Actinomycetota bacterium]